MTPMWKPGASGELQSLAAVILHIEEQASLLHCPVKEVATSQCLKMLQDILQTSHTGERKVSSLAGSSGSSQKCMSVYLPDDKRATLKPLLQLIFMLDQQGKLNHKELMKMFQQLNNVPLDVLWLLHKSRVLTVDQYITLNIGQPAEITSFITGLVEVACGRSTIPDDDNFGHPSGGLTSNSRKSDFVVGTFVTTLVQLAYSSQLETSTSRSVKTISVIILNNLTRKMLHRLFDDEEVSRISSYTNLFGVIGLSEEVDVQTLKKFCTHQLSFILSYRPELKVVQAITDQEKWTTAKMLPFLKKLFVKLLAPFEVAEAIELIQRVLETQEVNWRSVLSLVSTLLVSCPEAPALFSALVKQLLNKAFQEFEEESMVTAFLLARQAVQEGPHVFPPYPAWFSSTFGDEVHSLANTCKPFAFLMKFLTNLVPFEPAAFLKTHITRAPFVPRNCRELLNDYIALAKTRLMDLGDSLEQRSLFGEGAGSSAGGNKQGLPALVQSDVEKVISMFEATGKIPNSLLEASIFRKSYYVGKFLPALLATRPLPDVPDARMRLIEMLSKADKVPKPMLQEYTAGCEREMKQLLEGVFTGDSEDVVMEPMEDLKACLETFQTTVLSPIADRDGKSVPEMLSVIAARMQNAISNESDVGLVDGIELKEGIEDKRITNSEEVILLFLATLFTCVKNVEVQQETGWMSCYISLIIPYPCLQRALYKRLWDMCIKEYEALGELQIVGLGVILEELGRLQGLFLPAWRHSPFGQQHMSSAFVDLLFTHLDVSSKDRMEFCLKLAEVYFQRALISTEMKLHYVEHVAYLPPSLVKKYNFLVPRLLTDHGPCQKLGAVELGASSNSEAFQRETSPAKLTLQEWLDLEYTVCPCCDALNPIDRQQYMYHVLADKFLPLLTDQGGCGCSVRAAATCLMQIMLRVRKKTPVEGSRSSAVCQKRDSSLELLMLLQRLLNTLEMESSDQLPWLLEQWRAAHTPDQLMGGGVEVTDDLIFRIASTLPPWLIFTNSLHVRPTSGTLAGAADLLNTHLRESLSEGGILSASLTTYLTSGLLLAAAGDAVLVARLTDRCPCLRVALVVHASVLSSQLPRQGVPEGTVVQMGHSLHIWAENVVSKETKPLPPVLVNASPHDCGIAIWAARKRSSHRQLTVEHSLLATGGDVEFTLLQCFVVEVTAGHFHGSYDVLDCELIMSSVVPSLKASLSKVWRILKQRPVLVEALDPNSPYWHQSVFISSLPLHMKNLLTIVIIKLVSTTVMKYQGVFKACETSLLQVLISNHTAWVHMCDSYLSSSAWPRGCNKKQYCAVDLHLLGKLGNTILRIIGSASSESVRSLPAVYLTNADADIQAAIKKRR